MFPPYRQTCGCERRPPRSRAGQGSPTHPCRTPSGHVVVRAHRSGGPVPGLGSFKLLSGRMVEMARPHERNARRLKYWSDRLPAPAYDRVLVMPGMVHVGVGGFHRAHQAMYHDRLMNQGAALDWSICGVGVLPEDLRISRPRRAGRPLHPDPQAQRRNLGTEGDRIDRAVPVRTGRSGGGHREDGGGLRRGSCL